MLFPVLNSADNWLDNSFNDFFNNGWLGKAKATVPSVNVKENDTQYEVEVAAPGMTKEDFNVTVSDDNRLIIKLEHKEEQNDKDDKGHYLRCEFAYNSFQQALSLPDDVDHEHIEARVDNGVLHVILPRKAEVKTDQRKIEVF